MRLEPGAEREKAENWAGWICAVIAAGIMATTMWTTVRAYLPLPLFDQWEELTVGDHVARLWSSHNEHIIFFPRLVFLVDKGLFGGSNAFNQTMTFVVQFVHAALLWVVARRAGLAKWVSAGVIFSTLFWCYQAENFLSGFQVQFVGVCAAVSAALFVLAFRRERGVGWAIALSFVATLTMSNGLLAGVLLVSLGVCLGLPRRHVAILSVGAVGTIATYFILTHLSRPTDPQAEVTAGRLAGALAHPGSLAAYVGAYLGGPFGRLLFRNSIRGDAAIGITVGIGFCGLIALAAVGGAIWRRGLGALCREDGEGRAQFVLIHIAMFGVLTAMMTAFGRAQRSPLYQAASLRYGAVALVFWLCLGFLVWKLASARLPWGGKLGAIAGFVLCAGIAASQPFIMRMVLTSPADSRREAGTSEQAHAIAGRLGDRQDALAAILSGVNDEEALSSIYPEPEQLPARIAKLRAARMAPFNQNWSEWLGSDLRTHVQISNESCGGKVDDVVAIGHDGWRVGGWEKGIAGRLAKRVVLASDAGIVVGYGLASTGATLKEALMGSSPRWRAYASGSRGSVVTAYALDSSGGFACSIGSTKLESESGLG